MIVVQHGSNCNGSPLQGDSGHCSPAELVQLRKYRLRAQLHLLILQGLLHGLMGPALPDLAALLGVNVVKITLLYTWRGIAAICGAALIGSLFDRFHSDLIFAVTNVIQGAFFVAFPWAPSLLVLAIFNVVSNGCTIGIIAGDVRRNSSQLRKGHHCSNVRSGSQIARCQVRLAITNREISFLHWTHAVSLHISPVFDRAKQ